MVSDSMQLSEFSSLLPGEAAGADIMLWKPARTTEAITSLTRSASRCGASPALPSFRVKYQFYLLASSPCSASMSIFSETWELGIPAHKEFYSPSWLLHRFRVGTFLLCVLYLPVENITPKMTPNRKIARTSLQLVIAMINVWIPLFMPSRSSFRRSSTVTTTFGEIAVTTKLEREEFDYKQKKMSKGI